ncbi:NUDIX domain-containing protein [Halopenitus salinus]|uniref:NUDIX domain-containing protein n=1 Tax=Halopenitus salinus TaxID=1198295 RepID=A0ABD5UV46_9EURY
MTDGEDGIRDRNGDGPTETHVVTVFLRHDADVLLLCRSDEVGSYRGRWGAVAGHAEGDPDAAARREIREETGLDPSADVRFIRRGDRFAVVDADLDRRWIVHPFLFAAGTRAVETNYETTAHEWVQPTAILDRETVPDLWRSYDRVRPTVETVRDDREHGSAALSVRALEVLRDEAAIADDRGSGDGTANDGAGDSQNWTDLIATARALRDARPAMPVVANRVNRVMADASERRTPASLLRAAIEGIDRALDADERAAARAATRLPDRVATLSRSGTVLSAISRSDPKFVLLPESRPGREGVTAVERIAVEIETDETEIDETEIDETDAGVTLTTDAAFGETFADRDVEALVVGADAILADGRVVNKVGTRGATAIAAAEGADRYVVAAADKVRPADSGAEFDREERDPTTVYDGDADLEVVNPTFGATPTERFDAVITEDGTLDAAGVREVAAAHRRRAGWDVK